MARGNVSDILGGLLFVTIGTVGAALSRNYEIGSASDMGPGYLPFGIFIIIGILGAIITLQGLAAAPELRDELKLRPVLAVIIGSAAFAALMRTGGFFVATLVLVVIASLADKEARFGQSVIVGTVLGIFGTVIFGIGLGIPLPAWPWSN
jgi:hypothetical protein